MSVEGMTDNAAGSPGATSGNITSGTASEAMIKAATAASSTDTPAGGSGTGTPDGQAGGGTPNPNAAATGAAAPPNPPAANGERGPIPYDRHEAAVRNARTEAAQQYQWAQELQAQGLKPDEIKAGVALLTRLRNDPKAFWAQLGSEVNPAGTGGTTEEETFELPGADLTSPDGKVKAYSETAHLKSLEVMEKKILSQFKKEMQPLIEFHSSEMTARQQADFDAKAAKIGDAALKRAMNMPHFKENQKAIAEKLAAVDPEVLSEIGPVAAMFEAYNMVLQEKVFPNIETAAEKKVREDYAKKANAGGSVHPTGGGGNVRKPELNNATQLAAHMEKLAAQMAST